VIHSYRYRFGYVPGDPAFEAIEQQLASRPPIRVPTIVLHGEANGVASPAGSASQGRFFTGPYRREVIPVAGHNLPQEAPAAVADAALELMRTTQ
jgi:pimeloyl-ACP methyl ester carboxylesterase